MRVILVAAVLLVPVSAACSDTAWVESPGTMILSDRAPGTTKAVDLAGVRSGTASAQIAVRADGDGGTPLSFEWTSLKGPAGEIAKENIQLFRAADIAVDHGQKVDAAKDKARERRLGSFPDALMPLFLKDGTNVANEIAREKDRTLAFWVDIFLPEKAVPGEYAGTITLKQAAAAVATIPVTLRVRNVAIPAESTFPSLFNLRLHPHVRANLDAYVAEALKHRVQPTNYHYLDDLANNFAMMDRYNPGGKGFVNVYLSDCVKPSPPREQQIADMLRKVSAHLKEKGLFDRAYLYLKDEPDAKEIEGIIEVVKVILRDAPEWKGKLLCTLNKEGTELDGVLTHHVRALKIYGSWYAQKDPPGGREAWDRRRAGGETLWFYVSNSQGWPYPTFDVNTVSTAFEPRVLPWAYWYEKAAGHLYWDLMFEPKWQLNRKFPPGDGQLIYPGDLTLPGAPAWALVKDLKGPVVSRRLKLQRQGLEDLELLKMAEAKVGRAKVQGVVDKVYRFMGQRTWAPDAYSPANPPWTYDESAWDKAREEIIKLLE